MPADVETMMYEQREVPWHGLGVPVEGCVRAEDAIRAAGLDWTVGKYPVTEVDGPNGRMAVDDPDEVAYLTVREGCALDVNGPKVLGVVGNQYTPVQNTEAFAFLDSLFEAADGEGAGGAIPLRYETAGSLQGGRRVWMLARLTETPEILVGGVDPTIPYLLLANSHDGNGSLWCLFTTIRVVCSNTLGAALAGGSSRGIALRHTGSIQTRLKEARRVLKMATDTTFKWGEVADRYYHTRISNNVWEAVVRLLLPAPPADTRQGHNQIQRDTLRRLFEAGTGMDLPGVRGTVWGAMNAITEYASHEKIVRGGAEGRLASVWFGAADNFITNGVRLLDQVMAGKGAELVAQADEVGRLLARLGDD